MATPRTLAKPPIVEALVDIQVQVQHSREDLEAFVRREFSGRYEKVDARHSAAATIEIRDGKLVQPRVEDSFHGIWASNGDGSRILQLTRAGLTVNHVGRYESGDSLLAEAVEAWRKYSRAFGTVSAKRVALRYINRLELPYQPGDDFNVFLTSAPTMPAECPQLMIEFLSRVVTRDGSNRMILTQRLHPEEGRPIITLDIDVFREEPQDPERIQGVLETLRELKNRTFFAMLTDRALELYS